LKKILKNEIVKLNTEILYRDGLLHIRGVIEKFEIDNTTYRMTNLNRKERWCVLLENNIKLYQSIQICVGIYSKQDLSNFIFNLYSRLRSITLKKKNKKLK
jgi:hypothetical protein